MRPASLEIKSDLLPKFWADPEVADRGGSDARLDARWAAAVVALRRGAPRRNFELMTLTTVPKIPLGC